MLKYSGNLQMGKSETDLLFLGKAVIEYLEKIYLKNRKTGLVIDDQETLRKLENRKNEEDIINLLDNKTYYRFVEKYYFVTLLSDFCLYMYKSLRSVFDFEPQIAFTLARKPLIDDVFYFQYLYVDPRKTIDLILSDDAKEKDVGTKKNRNLDKDNYDKIAKDFGYKHNIFHYLRYGDDKYTGILKMCNKASHIVISKDNFLKTIKGELNFIGMSDEDIEYYIYEYLACVPALLLYIAMLALKIHERIYRKEDKPLRNKLDELQKEFDNIITNIKQEKEVK